MVTWKTPIVDLAMTSPAEVGMPAEDEYNTVQSKYNKMFKGCMWLNPCIRHHPAYKTLFEYATEGCPVDCRESWSREQLEAAIHRGNHALAQDPQAAKCFHKEALEKVEQGSARIVKWADICDKPHLNLKISPLAASHTRVGFNELSWTCPFSCELKKFDSLVLIALPHQDPTINQWIKWVEFYYSLCTKWPMQTLPLVLCFLQNGN